MKNIRIITASAGTGKTTELARLLDEAIGAAKARPEGIVATTFTRQAAAELQNRARSRLLRSGRAREAQALLTARIGTVNAVCGSLVSDFSFELGLSPELRVLDEKASELALKQTLASVVSEDESDELDAYKNKFDMQFDWQYEVRRIVEAARANGLGPERLLECAARSKASLEACLGPAAKDGNALDAALNAAIDAALAAIPGTGDTTDGTAEYCDKLRNVRRAMGRGGPRWGDWANLTSAVPKKKALDHAGPVQAAARRHLDHPRLRGEMHALIGSLFGVASRGLEAYQAHKLDRGLMDYVDQEVLALAALSHDDVRAALEGRIDLVLVDEFQDTSPLQLAIFLKLAELATESVWVGDPKQAIFGFRGTDPSLMDAAIESLSHPARDPELVNAAVASVGKNGAATTLSKSYRSRPGLVDVTNAIFTRAFPRQQDMQEDRVRVEAARPEAPELGPALTYWPLSGRSSNAERAKGVAAGLRTLMQEKPMVWDRELNAIRPATPADVGILCRTHALCGETAEALGELGFSAVLARMGLLESAEAQVLLEGLRLWVDPYDSLAAATLLRVLDHPTDADSFVRTVIQQDGHELLRQHPLVAAVNKARVERPDAGVLPAIDAVIDALGLRRLCAEWGNAGQRVANLDALRAHASAYCNERRSGRDTPSLAGFIAHLAELAQEDEWGKKRGDACARVGGERAVTVSTWHAAKGLEWPIVVLFGLETLRLPVAYGVHMMSDRVEFDVDDPLGGRWIHFWPNPYTNSGQKGPVKDAYAASDTYGHVADRNAREALRVLYVGWTRARDRLILAAQDGKMLGGLLKTLEDIEPGLIGEPSERAGRSVSVRWAGHDFMLGMAPQRPAAPAPAQPVPGEVRVGKPAQEYARARMSPSSAPPRSCTLAEAIKLGPPLEVHGAPDAAVLGTAVHDFIAMDDPERTDEMRIATATRMLERFQIAGAVSPAELVSAADRLWAWVGKNFQAPVLRREWPLGFRDGAGTLVAGTADLIVETEQQIAIVDHKSYRSAERAAVHAEALAGQLGCYRDAVARVFPGREVTTWVHLPMAGVVVPVRT